MMRRALLRAFFVMVVGFTLIIAESIALMETTGLLPETSGVPAGMKLAAQPVAGASYATATVTEPGKYVPTITVAAGTTLGAPPLIETGIALPVTGDSGCIAQGSAPTLAEVTQVISGDTIQARIAGETYMVRYAGVQALKKEDGGLGEEAAARNQELVGGKQVILLKDVSDAGAPGELLRYVVAGDLFVNLELVRLGYVLASPANPDLICAPAFQLAQETAIASRSGLWEQLR